MLSGKIISTNQYLESIFCSNHLTVNTYKSQALVLYFCTKYHCTLLFHIRSLDTYHIVGNGWWLFCKLYKDSNALPCVIHYQVSIVERDIKIVLKNSGQMKISFAETQCHMIFYLQFDYTCIIPYDKFVNGNWIIISTNRWQMLANNPWQQKYAWQLWRNMVFSLIHKIYWTNRWMGKLSDLTVGWLLSLLLAYYQTKMKLSLPLDVVDVDFVYVVNKNSRWDIWIRWY